MPALSTIAATHIRTTARLELALADYNEAIRLGRPTRRRTAIAAPCSWRWRGRARDCRLRSGDRRRPRYASALHNRGLAYTRQGRFELAIADHSEAIRLSPEYAAAYNGRGYARSAQGDADRALLDFDRSIALDPGAPEVFVNRGVLLFRRADFTGAGAEFDRALAIDRDYAHALFSRGVARLKTGDGRGIADIKDAECLRPEVAEVMENEGVR